MKNSIAQAWTNNENDFRKKVLIGAGLTIAALAVAVGVSVVKDNTEKVILVVEEATDAIEDATSE